MRRRQLAGLIAAILCVLTLSCAFSIGIAGRQETTKGHAPARAPARDNKVAPQPFPRESDKRGAEIAKMVADFDLAPHPLPSIPDDPPPHEGAMISLPHIVEPPDLILVEVLDALPGRPISGERLVRPDGKIDIGFYGEVYVRGMTLEQVKVAIIKHLRKYLTDESLGLETSTGEVEGGLPLDKPPIPEIRRDAGDPFELEDKSKLNVRTRSSSTGPRSVPRTPKPRTASGRAPGRPIPVRPIRSTRVLVATQDQEAPPPAANTIKLPAGAQGKVTITIEFDRQGRPAIEKPPNPPVAPSPPEDRGDDELARAVVPPAESLHVFVDMTAYNSKNYYILGDVQITGKLPWTGNETVLDALQYAGGLMATAEPKDIRLVRPGWGGKPARVYKVDLAAIQQKGDVMTNYQIFPNDRLIVGRNEVVKKTVEIDRLNAPIQSITGYMLQEAFVLRYLQFVTTDNREDLLNELVDFWARELSRPDGVKFDEQTLRDAIMRKMKLTPAPLQPAPAAPR